MPRVRRSTSEKALHLQSCNNAVMCWACLAAGYNVTAEFKGGASVPIGKPLANMRCYVLGSQQQLLPIGIPGELMVSGIQLARGYLKQRELTDQAFIANPYSGGDPHHNRLYRTGASITKRVHALLLHINLSASLWHKESEMLLPTLLAQATWQGGCQRAASSFWAASTIRSGAAQPTQVCLVVSSLQVDKAKALCRSSCAGSVSSWARSSQLWRTCRAWLWRLPWS